MVYLTVMIRNNGQYAVGKVIGSSYIPLVPWTAHYGLGNTDIGIWNKIKVAKGEGNEYNLWFNDKAADAFADDVEPRCEGYVRNGYIVVIAPDDLNKGDVEVFFKE